LLRRTDYYAFEERLRAAGSKDDGKVICRWRHRESGLILDATPTDAALLGFEKLASPRGRQRQARRPPGSSVALGQARHSSPKSRDLPVLGAVAANLAANALVLTLELCELQGRAEKI
jgi:hypothetical protein